MFGVSLQETLATLLWEGPKKASPVPVCPSLPPPPMFSELHMHVHIVQ
jgi:hypothetical protein